MSVVLQKPNPLLGQSPFDSLLDYPYNEPAWLSVFGEENLRSRVCTIIIREQGIMRMSGDGSYKSTDYRRRSLAYC